MYASTQLHLCNIRHGVHMRARVHDVWVLIIYCRLHNIKRQIPKPLKMYYPGPNEQNDDNSVSIASILANEKEQRWIEYSEQVSWKWKFNHPLQVFCRRDKTHSYNINAYFLIKGVGRYERHLNSVCLPVWGEVKFTMWHRRVTVRKCMALVTLKLKKKSVVAWYMVDDDNITIGCVSLAWYAVLLGKQLLLFEVASSSQMLVAI